MEENQNLGTHLAQGNVKCETCDYIGGIETYLPALTVYQDIYCPKCGSSRNEHNRIYQKRLFKSIKETEEEK